MGDIKQEGDDVGCEITGTDTIAGGILKALQQIYSRKANI